MKQILLFAGILLSLATIATAQTTAAKDQPTATFTIQLGTFDPAVKQADFEAIRSYAYVYKRDGIVFAGGFADETSAEPILAKIKARGFSDAFVAARSLKKSKTVYVIQIATKNASEPINWATYARVGDLYSMPNGGQVRLVHGFYADKNDANIKLKEIISWGFADAFVKGVKDVQLNSVSDFDTGDKRLVVKSVNVTPKSVPQSYSYTPTTASLKRKSVLKLQEALKEVGTFGNLADGIFGHGTQTSFDRALSYNKRLAVYNDRAQQHEGFGTWTSVRLLLTMTRDLNLKNDPPAIVPDLLNNLPNETLSSADATAALNWHAITWKKLEAWSTKSEYCDQVYTALKVAYYHSLVSLENYYSAKGLRGDAGTALSVSVLRTLIDGDLDGFN